MFSAKSVYYGLTQGASVSHFRDVWRARVPPKIKVFLWQLIWGKLPSSEQVAKRHGPSNGRCSLCGEMEDCNHIFFTCHMAGFMWAGVRELLHCEWNPGGIGDFIALAQGISGPLRSLVWFTFAAMAWSLWNIRNKLTIEGKLINNPTDAFYHMMLHMQSWRVLVRRRVRALLDEALEARESECASARDKPLNHLAGGRPSVVLLVGGLALAFFVAVHSPCSRIRDQDGRGRRRGPLRALELTPSTAYSAPGRVVELTLLEKLHVVKPTTSVDESALFASML
ncbi:hypothetical protein QYE76_066489 [Lolium multiflorum]|uniref:Reverse transcriptase zinc-binding domain-containing protein n=1 Tax=Lolium multiflorum TaxID=4521 RepID=A0AAD8SBG2_LOLMU|nr:hypothetical protein QYE76_066489 [Lolium multiflorum]